MVIKSARPAHKNSKKKKSKIQNSKKEIKNSQKTKNILLLVSQNSSFLNSNSFFIPEFIENVFFSN